MRIQAPKIVTSAVSLSGWVLLLALSAGCGSGGDTGAPRSSADTLELPRNDANEATGDAIEFEDTELLGDTMSAPSDTATDRLADTIIPPPSDAAVRSDASSTPPTIFGGDRPATLNVPSSYVDSEATPLVLILHGFYYQPGYILPAFKMETFHEEMGVLTIAPQGLKNPGGNHFWNGSPSCCDFFGANVDDVGYLSGLIESIQAAYNVDSRRIYAIGHSNGSFMANRLACERPELIAGIVSVAGAANLDCTPAGPVSVLHAHGTNDGTIYYVGGMLGGYVYPGAVGTVDYWAEANGCSSETESLGTFDFNKFVFGEESEKLRYMGCPEGITVELWTEPQGGHLPRLPDDFAGQWWEWMSAHPKPE